MHESLVTRELSAIGYLCHEEEYAVAAIGDTSVRLLVFHKNKAYKETESRHHHHHPSVISVASFQGPGPPVCYILSTARVNIQFVQPQLALVSYQLRNTPRLLVDT